MEYRENLSHDELQELLDSEAARINSPQFVANDPVQFPRRFNRLQDIEIAALLSATIAWGNRKMICRNCNRLLEMMDNAPYDFVMEGGVEQLSEGNIHRTFFVRNLRHYLRGLRAVYTRHASLADFAIACGAPASEAPSWTFAEALNRVLTDANAGTADCRCLPQNMQITALKRINMAFRWLVRRDGIVDLGVWDFISPSQLYIPLDVHVADISRRLGLLDRRSNDRRAVVQLTDALRRFNREDPAVYDFALFGIGMGL